MGGWGDCCGFRMDAARGNVPEAALPLELLLLAPDAAHHLERLVPDGAGITRIDLESLLLVGVAPTGAEVDASARYVVGHGDFLSHADRVLVGQHDDTEAEPMRLVRDARAPMITSGADEPENVVRKWCSTNQT